MKKKILFAVLIFGLSLLLACCSEDFEYSSFKVETGEIPVSVYNEALKMKDESDPFFQDSSIRDFLKKHPENKNYKTYKTSTIGISTFLKECKIAPDKIFVYLKLIQIGGDFIEYINHEYDEDIKVWLYVEPVKS
ncbi:MAG: hypothetical protein KBT21_00280 [Treponema sp.]|nr:hypothetical protein [Candidatus Treponema merdequi]